MKMKESDLPTIIAQDKQAWAAIQDIASYEKKQEALALLKILTLGQQQVEDNQLTPIGDVVQRLKKRSKKD